MRTYRSVVVALARCFVHLQSVIKWHLIKVRIQYILLINSKVKNTKQTPESRLTYTLTHPWLSQNRYIWTKQPWLSQTRYIWTKKTWLSQTRYIWTKHPWLSQTWYIWTKNVFVRVLFQLSSIPVKGSVFRTIMRTYYLVPTGFSISNRTPRDPLNTAGDLILQ